MRRRIGENTVLRCNGETVKVYFFPFGCPGIRGCLRYGDDGYNIFVNTEISEQAQRFALGHELAHLFLKHMQAGELADDLEDIAHRTAWTFYRFFRDGEFDVL